MRLIFGYALNGHGPNYIRRRLEEEKIPCKIESDREIYTTLFNKKYLKLPKIFLDGNINEEELIEK